ncbi:MAG: hypothetical protein M1289_02225 [Patescibacteria group bacterium]|nr:hypothetical protein [Patescibacteria group bacterium]
MNKFLAFFSGLIFVLLLTGFFFAQRSFAATLHNVSDTITTSRPSASAPVASNVASTDTQATITDNGSIFLASDSATLRADTGETLDSGVTVASMSAANTPSSGQRIVYFVNAVGHSHHAGDPATVPIAAMHKISFTTINSIPASGKIIFTFPSLAAGDANTPASPSASTFQLNGLTGTNISYKLDGTRTCTFTVTNPTSGTSPTITCTVDAGGSVPANTPITFLIGCNDGSSNETSCTTQDPLIINPTKTAAAGTADTWAVKIQTQDSNGVTIDSSRIKIGTIDVIVAWVSVEPTLTFTIAGIANSTAINNGNTTGCTNTETTNSGIPSTATTVNLGTLSSGAINISAQLLTITTNAPNGYTLTATSSGHLINPATGFWIHDSTSPTAMTVGTPWFGIHACGLDVATATWGSGATGGGTGAKYGWPTPTSSVSLASDSTGPVGNSITAGNGLISVEYGSTIDISVPAGTYTSVVTYVVTPTF